MNIQVRLGEIRGQVLGSGCHKILQLTGFHRASMRMFEGLLTRRRTGICLKASVATLFWPLHPKSWLNPQTQCIQDTSSCVREEDIMLGRNL